METVIRVVDVSKRFNIHKDKSLKERLVNFRRSRDHAEEFWALRDVSLDVEAGSTVGLIGHNGSGKSTLLKVIGGILSPNSGQVLRRGRLAALLELGAGFHGDLSGRENVFLNASILGLSRSQTEEYFDEIVDFSGIEQFIDTQVKFYSSGMYVRLAFAVAVHVDPEILLIDEVLAVGDEPFQRKCMDKIKRFQREGRTIVLVTHGLDVVRQMCDRAVMLEHGEIIVDGSPIQAIRTFRERYEDVPPEDLPEDWVGNKQMTIDEVRILDADGRPKTHFLPGEPLTVEFDVSAREPVGDWVAGVALVNHFDQVVFGTTSERLGTRFEPLRDGRRVVRWSFPTVPLVDGQYHLDVAVADSGVRTVYHRLNRVGGFKVTSDSGEDGTVHLEPRVEVSGG